MGHKCKTGFRGAGRGLALVSGAGTEVCTERDGREGGREGTTNHEHLSLGTERGWWGDFRAEGIASAKAPWSEPDMFKAPRSLVWVALSEHGRDSVRRARK